MMTDEEVRQFNEAGVVTMNTPLTAQEVSDAAAALDQLLPFDGNNHRPSRTCDYYDPAFLAVTQHPFFEETARRVLDAKRVHFFQSAILAAYPEPGTPFSFWQHVDIQYRRRDFQAVPKNIICSFFLWLTDVNEKRAPMMVRPGSHLLLGDYREHDPGWEEGPPRVAPVPLAHLPALPYADPIPLTATAGQVSVLTTATVHGASVNVDSEPRKNFVLTFTATDVIIALPPGEEAQKRDYHRGLRARLRPERAHIIPA